MGCAVRFTVSVNAHFSFTKARYAGRYDRGQISRTG